MVLRQGDPLVSRQLLGVLSAGEVAIVLCDTIYGFVGKAPDTERKIRMIKGRGEENPFLLLAGAVEQVEGLSNAPLDPRVTALWPGPLTVVMNAPEGTVAVRLPDDPFLTEIVRSLGQPIYSTSVNRSGNPPMHLIAEIIREFESEVDLIVDAGDQPAGLPSTILDVTNRPYRVLRQGEFEVPSSLLES